MPANPGWSGMARLGSLFALIEHSIIMTSSERQAWEKVRAKGRAHYITFIRILRLGVLCGTSFAILPWLLALTSLPPRQPLCFQSTIAVDMPGGTRLRS